ncbi:hypothetical protein [Microbacterium sp. P04]|uniref:hypothetical protein n=1 Tax=Microbacterium sp. P04 TaxID=3366947 RepID=UPI00374730E3
MNKTWDFGLGVALGISGFYGLSLASALWVARVDPLDYLWALLLSAAICCIFGLVVAWRASLTLAAAVVMLILVVIGFIAGTDQYLWVMPFPRDVVALFFHGSRSPLVVGPTFLIGAAAVFGLLRAKRSVAPVQGPVEE